MRGSTIKRCPCPRSPADGRRARPCSKAHGSWSYKHDAPDGAGRRQVTVGGSAPGRGGGRAGKARVKTRAVGRREPTLTTTTCPPGAPPTTTRSCGSAASSTPLCSGKNMTSLSHGRPVSAARVCGKPVSNGPSLQPGGSHPTRPYRDSSRGNWACCSGQRRSGAGARVFQHPEAGRIRRLSWHLLRCDGAIRPLRTARPTHVR